MKPKQKEEAKEAKATTNDHAEITGKAAEGGLPHGPPAGMYDAHETEVLNAKAEDQLRVLRDRNKPSAENPNA